MTFKTHYEPVPVTEKPERIWIMIGEGDLIKEIDPQLLNDPVFDVDFNGSYLVQITSENGNYRISNAMDGWGNNCLEDFNRPVSFLSHVRPRPDTVLLTREEVEAIRKELIEIKEAFQWTFDNMGTQHTSDHFNIPANGVQQVDQLINNQFK